MPDKDQDFVDFLFSSISSDINRYARDAASFSRDVADSIDAQFETVAASLRTTLQTTPWIPESIRPPPPPPHRVHHYVPFVPLGYFAQLQTWVSRNRAITAAVIAFVGTGTFVIWRKRRQYRQKRRARRAANGARTEVVVLAGSPHSPLTRSLALDLERRGFVVYIPVSTLSEEQTIRAELRADIHPLNIDVTSPSSTAETLGRFSNHLTTLHRNGSIPHRLHLTSLILLPPYPSTHPTGAISSLSPSLWSDTLNTHLLYPFTIVRAFLPLLISQSDSRSESAASHAFPSPKTSVILLTPSITPSLAPPLRGPESLTASALTSYMQTLRAELSPHSNMAVTQLKLGAFDFSQAPGSRQQLATIRANRYGSTSKEEMPQRSWMNEYLTGISKGDEEYKGSSLRVLHNGVFDAIVGRTRGTIFVGKGSWTYDLVGRLLPKGAVWWMLGKGVGSGPAFGGNVSAGEGSVEWEKIENENGE